MHGDGEEDAYEAYYRSVELQWSLARGRQIIVSPLEFEEIERWYLAGVPLTVVLRAIDLFVEKKKKAKRQKGYLLKDAAGTVKSCHREYRQIHEGEGEESDLLGSKMKALIAKVRALGRRYPDQAEPVASISSQLAAIDLKAILDFESVDNTLQDLEGQLIQPFKGCLSPEETQEIHAEVGEFLTPEEDPDLYAKMVHDVIRVHFGLPKLTLLG